MIPMFEIGGKAYGIARLGGDFDPDQAWRDSSSVEELRAVFPEDGYSIYVTNTFEAKAALFFCFYTQWAWPFRNEFTIARIGMYYLNTVNELMFFADSFDRLMLDCSVKFWRHGAESISMWRFGAKSWKECQNEVIEGSDAYAFLKTLPSIESE